MGRRRGEGTLRAATREGVAVPYQKEKLADSRNSKVVIIGSGKNGLPLILGGRSE